MKNTLKKAGKLFVILAGTASLHAASPGISPNPDNKGLKKSTPTLQVVGQKVFVNHLNLEGQKITIKVYDEESRLLYVENFEQTPVVAKAFNFENAYEGVYSVVLIDNKTAITAEIAVSL